MALLSLPLSLFLWVREEETDTETKTGIIKGHMYIHFSLESEWEAGWHIQSLLAKLDSRGEH